MNNLDNIIDNYLISSEPYALQINGGWGTGKTYYLKNYVKKRLKEQENYVVYFSVYGFDSLAQLKREILYSIITEVKPIQSQLGDLSKATKGLNRIIKLTENTKLQTIGLVTDAILEYFQTRPPKELDKPLIIIVDDIERISTKIDIEDLLGFISNELLEKLKCKVIILSNSAEMNKQEEFQRVKEKTIYRTAEFSYSVSLIEETIIKQSRNEFIRLNSTWISSILNSEDSAINIRTLIAVIENYSLVEKRLSSQIDKLAEEKNKLALRKSLFLNIYVITREYKLATVTENNMKELSSLVKSNKYISDYYDKHDGLIKNIIKKYHNKNQDFDDYIFYSEDINNYVILGYFDDANYLNEWSHKFIPTIIDNPGDKINLLWNFRKMSDEKFEELQKSIMFDIENEKYDLELLINAYAQLDKFKNLDLIFLKPNYAGIIEEKICKEYEKVARTEHATVEEKVRFNPLIDIEEKKPDLFLQLKEIDRHINQQRLIDFIEIMFTNDKAELQKAKENISNLKFQLIRQMLEEDTVNKYIVIENNNADNLTDLLDSKFFLSYEDKDSIKKFMTSIEDNMKKKKLGKIDSYKVSRLLDSLSKLIDDLPVIEDLVERMNRD